MAAAAIALVISPLTSLIVRHRAAYYPKPLDGGGNAWHLDNPLTLINISKKVFATEGVEGLFKGIVPFFIVQLIGMVPKFYISPSPITIYGNITFFYNILYLFLVVISYRAIVTHHSLQLSKPQQNIPLLFTNIERERPHTLLFTPGLMVGYAFSAAVQIYVFVPTREYLWAHLSTPPDVLPWGDLIPFAAAIALSLVSTAILSPFDVITTRLAVQKNYSGPKYVPNIWVPWHGSASSTQSTPAPSVLPTSNVSHNAADIFNASSSSATNKVQDVKTKFPATGEDLEAGMSTDGESVEIDIGTLLTPTVLPPPPPYSRLPESSLHREVVGDPELELQRELAFIDAIENPIVRYRKEPYSGFIDCFQTIRREEGMAALYRGWWLTFAGQLFQPTH